MYSTQAWAAHYGLPLNAPEDFVQGYADGMRLDAKGQGKPCGRGFIAPGKKCSAKGSRQLAADLKAGDAGAKARVATGKRNAMAQQAARRAQRPQPAPQEEEFFGEEMANPFEGGDNSPAPQKAKRQRSPETIAKQKATREAKKAKQQALWGSRANTPKRLQRQTVKIEGGKVRKTRAVKGRSSAWANLYR
jgi:hypothetical protein